MSFSGIGYWKSGLWTTGYWNDAYWPQKHITLPTVGLTAPTIASRTSVVVNALDDAGGASGFIGVSIGSGVTPDTGQADTDDTGQGQNQA